MLKRGTIDGPFTKRPGSGPLPSLPSYMVSCSHHVRYSLIFGLSITSFFNVKIANSCLKNLCVCAESMKCSALDRFCKSACGILAQMHPCI